MEALAAAFARHQVVAAYVFGSVARGRDPRRVTGRSDLDLAVLFPHHWMPTERRQRAGMLERDLLDVFDRGDFDLVVANDAPLVLRRHIARERDVIFGRDTPERVAFDARAVLEYLDTEPLRQMRYRAMARRAREGRFGVRDGAGTSATERA